ncbi:autotransporter outer membrane beta-barrel domain-containing protein [Rhodobacteraceae bacterium KMM 6894]|nr:autotransporter outer membrane beta-barrel domain-containing protein [Rhodobacteraceae bacterium KMM 6894]
MRFTNMPTLPCLASALALGLSTGAMAQVAPGEPGHGSPSDQLAASDAAQARSSVFVTSILSQRFSPVTNAFSIPGAPGSGTAQGLAGGDAALPDGWSIWSSVVGRHTENNFAPEEQSSDIWTLSMGADRAISAMTTLGVSLTFSREDGDTAFGTGTKNADSMYIAPYANFKLNDWLTADVSVGYGYTDSSQMRSPFGAPISGSYDSQSLFGAANLTASKWNGPVLMSGVIGLSGSSTDRSSFVESDGTVNASDTSELLQARVGGTLGFWAEPMLPYVAAEYVYDLDYDRSTVPGAPNDRDEFRLTLGSHIYGKGDNQDVSGGLSITHAFGRDGKDDTSANLSLRIAF